jgi:hypothetical protein
MVKLPMPYQWNESEEDILGASEQFAEAQRKVRWYRPYCIIGMVGTISVLIGGIGMVVENGFLAGGPWIACALLLASSIGMQYLNLRFRATALSLVHKLKRGETITAHDHPA